MSCPFPKFKQGKPFAEAHIAVCVVSSLGRFFE